MTFVYSTDITYILKTILITICNSDDILAFMVFECQSIKITVHRQFATLHTAYSTKLSNEFICD